MAASSHSEALITARYTADQIQAHSFVIDFADGTTDRHVLSGMCGTAMDGDGTMSREQLPRFPRARRLDDTTASRVACPLRP